MKAELHRVYLDHAATTPVRREVLDAMLPYFSREGYNASSIHAEGRRARAALDDARERVAAVMGCRPKEIVFCSGGTEADNLAVFGVAHARRGRGRHIVASAIEHHAVLRALDALREETILATVMLANNEIGTVEPVAELAGLARERGAVFHADAVQAPGQLALDLRRLGVDCLAISAHKFYGPPGVGALFVREGTPLEPLLYGGGQERGRRSGTEDVVGAVGLAAALELAEAERPAFASRVAALRDRLEGAIAGAIPDVTVNAKGVARLPNNLSVSFTDLDAEPLLIRLDLEGIAASAGSACATGSLEPSHVIAALGLPERTVRGTLRFSLGRSTSADEIDWVAQILPAIVAAQREGGTVSV